MTDAELDQVFWLLHLQKRRVAIRKLLRGNDACCFTTDQYSRVMLAAVAESANRPLDDVIQEPYWHRQARKQLRHEGLVEVQPDVWSIHSRAKA